MNLTSKYLAVNYHWFWEHLGKNFEIDKIDSKNQKGGLFTKGIQGENFWRIKKLLCGC